MQKRLFFLSMVLFTCLVYLSENSRTQPRLDDIHIATEHNILLDLTSQTDKIIYDNLIFSNYNCNTLNPKQALCSQFQVSNEVISSDGTVIEAYKFKAKNGDNVKIYTLSNGEAHIEFRLEGTQTLHKYSFTSIEKIPLFTNKRGLFKTGSLKNDINFLEKTL